MGEPGPMGPPGPQGPPGPLNGGLVYTRWGRTTCPSTSGTQLVYSGSSHAFHSASYQSAFSTEYTLEYSGRAAGSHAFHKGGGSDILCMPDDPEYSDYAPGVQGTSSIWSRILANYRTASEFCSTTQRAMCCVLW